jgi:hypothetical protein
MINCPKLQWDERKWRRAEQALSQADQFIDHVTLFKTPTGRATTLNLIASE